MMSIIPKVKCKKCKKVIKEGRLTSLKLNNKIYHLCPKCYEWTKRVIRRCIKKVD